MFFDANSSQIWQVSGGPADRSYSDLFIRYGVALIGPGDPGPWAAERNDSEFEGSYVRRLATEMQPNDIVLLRLGCSCVCAVGLVANEGYRYLAAFDDVNGWDLQHARRVRWKKLPENYDFGPYAFGANPSRLSRVYKEEVVEFAFRFLNSPPSDWQFAQLPDLPEVEPDWENVPDNIAPIVAQVHDLVGFYWDEVNFGELPTEDELIAHYVIPLLRSLGWPPELIAVKWRNVDIAIFRKLPRIPENCHFIIEAKRLGAGVEGAFQQARDYLDQLGIIRDIVVTDGIRYRLYDAEYDFQPMEYANFSWLKVSAAKLFDRLRRPPERT